MQIGADFYHSSVHLEKGLNRDAREILARVEHEIRSIFVAEHKGAVARNDKWSLDIDNVHFYAIQVLDDSVSLIARAVFVTSEGPRQEAHVRLRAVFRLRDFYAQWDPQTEEWVDYWIIRVEGGMPGLPSHLLFPYSRSGLNQEVLWLPMSRALTMQIKGFRWATLGFPSEVRGSFVRMLYLSAVTITTLGYGDIVPLTTRARLLVTAEAVLGIIVIGLFLNSLAADHGRSSKIGEAGPITW